MKVLKYKVFKKVFMKYRIMTIRAKISYSAFEQGSTIAEHILNSIIKTHNIMAHQNLIKSNLRTREIETKVLDNITNNNVSVLKLLMAENLKVVID